MAKRKTKKANQLVISLIVIILVAFLSYLGVPELKFLDTFLGNDKQEQTTKASSSKKGDNPGPIDNGLSTFTKAELEDSIKGWIEYGKLDNLGRATTANALIKPAMIGTGSSASQNIRPPGFISGLDPDNHSRGHLIGKQLGGTGEDERNLVTLYQNPVNTPYMTKYENMIRQAADEGETIRYRVTPIYDGAIGMPVAVKMEAKSLKVTSEIDFNVTIENKK